MTTKVADRVVLDTNVLLAATDTARVEYSRAREALDEWPGRGTTLYTTGQILREYLSVATRPEERNGLGLSRVDSVANARAFCRRLRLLAENEKVSERLLALLDDVSCAGKQVHDANIVATMLVHGVDTLVTINTDDFARFEKLLRIRKL
jgi:predicted nucleic acid-binding protein